ncbi:MAG TPA: SRPBCC family protein [Xanthobacteraceae bacterium]|nr:SRPBCC family protein [Xanthobacteraceae bacterium]
MKFDNSFVVPIPPAEAWPLLLDVPTIAPCLPGAQITEVLNPRKFKGRASVKIGPVQLNFDGEAEIVDVDDQAMTARVVAKGNEKKGRGNASATASFSLAPDPAGAKITVETELSLVGSIAQYGRGVGLIKDISNQLITQFAKNLESVIRTAAGEAGVEAPVAGKPISGLGLLGGAIKAAVTRKFSNNPS